MDAVYVSPVGRGTPSNLGIKVELYEGASKIAETRTNTSGVYSFTGINVLNTCKTRTYKVKVVTDDQTYRKGALIFTDKGYYNKTTDAFGFSCANGNAVKSMSSNRIDMQDIFVVRKLGNYEYLVLVEWDGSLGGQYMDLHMRNPSQDPASYPANQGVYYGSQGNKNLTVAPHGYLSCYHEDGTENCNTFDTKPQVLQFKVKSDAGVSYYSDPRSWHVWLNDFQCGGGTDQQKNDQDKPNCRRFAGNTQTLFTNKNTRVSLYKWNATDGLYKTYIPPTGNDATGNSTGGYWELMHVINTGGFDADYNDIRPTRP